MGSAAGGGVELARHGNPPFGGPQLRYLGQVFWRAFCYRSGSLSSTSTYYYAVQTISSLYIMLGARGRITVRSGLVF